MPNAKKWTKIDKSIVLTWDEVKHKEIITFYMNCTKDSAEQTSNKFNISLRAVSAILDLYKIKFTAGTRNKLSDKLSKDDLLKLPSEKAAEIIDYYLQPNGLRKVVEHFSIRSQYVLKAFLAANGLNLHNKEEQQEVSKINRIKTCLKSMVVQTLDNLVPKNIAC